MSINMDTTVFLCPFFKSESVLEHEIYSLIHQVIIGPHFVMLGP